MFCGCFYTICIHAYVGIFQNTEKSLHLARLALLWSYFVHQQGKETKDNKKKMGKKPKHELNDTKMFCRALILPWLKYFPCILLLFIWQKNTVDLMKFDCHNLVHIAKFVLNAWVPETLPWNAYREVWCLTFLSASVFLPSFCMHANVRCKKKMLIKDKMWRKATRKGNKTKNKGQRH